MEDMSLTRYISSFMLLPDSFDFTQSSYNVYSSLFFFYFVVFFFKCTLYTFSCACHDRGEEWRQIMQSKQVRDKKEMMKLRKVKSLDDALPGRWVNVFERCHNHSVLSLKVETGKQFSAFRLHVSICVQIVKYTEETIPAMSLFESSMGH